MSRYFLENIIIVTYCPIAGFTGDNTVVDPKRIIGKNGGPRRRRGTRGH
jgi:hypothetical protein